MQYNSNKQQCQPRDWHSTRHRRIQKSRIENNIAHHEITPMVRYEKKTKEERKRKFNENNCEKKTEWIVSWSIFQTVWSCIYAQCTAHGPIWDETTYFFCSNRNNRALIYYARDPIETVASLNSHFMCVSIDFENDFATKPRSNCSKLNSMYISTLSIELCKRDSSLFIWFTFSALLAVKKTHFDNWEFCYLKIYNHKKILLLLLRARLTWVYRHGLVGCECECVVRAKMRKRHAKLGKGFSHTRTLTYTFIIKF